MGSAELHHHRQDLEAAYPALFALGGDALDTACRKYFELHPPRGDTANGTDILQFGAFMQETLRKAESLPSYTAELVRFVHVLQRVRFAPDVGRPASSRAKRQVTLRDRPARAADVVLEHFSYNITQIEEALRDGRKPDPREQEEHVAYGRRREDGEPVVLRVSAATALLVELCDGNQTIGAVIAGAAPSCLRPVMAPGALRAVERLIEVGIFEMHGADG